jgi:ribosomal RNA assembly protein
MLSEIQRIPMERVAVLIGSNGKTKKELEKKTNTQIEVDSKTGEVEVKAREGNAINFYIALNIIKAIGRGFSPEHAFLLTDEQNALEIIDLTEVIGKSEKALKQKRGRVIGKKGRMRKEIEEKTSTFISVYGKSIGVIGRIEDIETSRRAILMLLKGARHKTVQDFLDKSSLSERKGFEL